MENQVIFIASNQDISNPKKANTHPMVIYNNYQIGGLKITRTLKDLLVSREAPKNAVEA